MKSRVVNGHEILTNGTTVWINGPDGCNLGRFRKSNGAADVHKTAREQVKSGEQCLNCGTMTWRDFCEAMASAHEVTIPADFEPKLVAV
jgi:hypothetical protein